VPPLDDAVPPVPLLDDAAPPLPPLDDVVPLDDVEPPASPPLLLEAALLLGETPPVPPLDDMVGAVPVGVPPQPAPARRRVSTAMRRQRRGHGMIEPP
jgi:hypothetical protein